MAIDDPERDSDDHWFFINTDATSLGDESLHDAWFHHGMAFTGGDAFPRRPGVVARI